MRTIISLFGRSPFGPTQAHMERVMDCVRQVRPLFDALVGGDHDRLLEVAAAIDELEAHADAAKNEIRDHLPKAVFLPIDRRDLLEIVHLQDGMADSLQETAGKLLLKPLAVAEEMKQPLQRFAADVLSTCEQTAEVIGRLDALLESTFGGPEAEAVLEMVARLDEAEGKSELLGRGLMRQLFAMEEQLSPIDIMLWYHALTDAVQVANNAERVGSRVRLLIAKA